MNTITPDLLIDAGHAVEAVELDIVHTVTIELNGATGRADIIIRGFDDFDLNNERVITMDLGVFG